MSPKNVIMNTAPETAISAARQTRETKMTKEQIIFRCPFYDRCQKDEPVYADNEIIIDIPAPECGHPFLLYKYTGDPLCQLTFDPDDPEFNLERYSETVLDHVRLYKKPLKQRLKEIFGGKK